MTLSILLTGVGMLLMLMAFGGVLFASGSSKNYVALWFMASALFYIAAGIWRLKPSADLPVEGRRVPPPNR